MTKKEKNCGPLDEGDMPAGDQWDFVALGPDSRLILSVFVGKRLRDNAEMPLRDVKARLAGVPELISGDEWPGSPEVIKEPSAKDTRRHARARRAARRAREKRSPKG